jgi:hypothetical protein
MNLVPTAQEINALWPSVTDGTGALVTAKVAKRMLTRRFNFPAGLSTYIDTIADPWTDIYIHTNPTYQDVERKARASDVTTWRTVLIDIDPDENNPNAMPDSALAVVTQQLNELGYECCYLVIDSGRGRQVWLCLGSMAPLFTTGHLARRQAEAAAANFLRQLGPVTQFGCRIDPCTSDLSRLARLPGGINSKTGGRAKLLLVNKTRLPAMIFYEQWKVPDTAPAEPMPIPGDGNWSKRKALGYISLKAAYYIMDGWTSPGRRQAVYATAVSLAEAGVPAETAWQWVVDGNEKSKPRPLSDKDLSLAFENGWRKYAGTDRD